MDYFEGNLIESLNNNFDIYFFYNYLSFSRLSCLDTSRLISDEYDRYEYNDDTSFHEYDLVHDDIVLPPAQNINGNLIHDI